MKSILKKVPFYLLILFFFNLNAQNLDCRLIERLGNNPEINQEILLQINEYAAGSEYKGLTNLKEIRIKKIESIRFEGCKMFAIARVVIDRKVRKNAKGVIEIKADVISVKNLLSQTETKSICIANAKIKDVDVTNTLNIGEKFYEWAANKVFPNNQCYEWQ